MLKLSVSFARKECPAEFSSLHAGCSIERELADGTPPEAIRQEAAALYGLAQDAVNAQIAAAQGQSPAAPPQHLPASQPAAANGYGRVPRLPGGNGHGGNGNGNGHARRTYRRGQTVMASAAQKKAIASICGERGLDVGAVLADWDGDIERLTIKEASQVIDALKQQQPGNGTRS